MDGLLQPPSATAFDVFSGIASAVLFLAVGLSAWVRAPRDVRARVFLVIALASLMPYLLPALLSRLGSGWLLSASVEATAVSLTLGSVALFHFTQVFPSRRPWIRAHGPWLVAAYVLTPVAALIGARTLLPIVRMASGVSTPQVDPLISLELLIVFLPTVFVVGIVLPFAGLLSLYKSWQEAKAEKDDAARVTPLTILISQLAGGALTILVVPLLHLIAPAGPWVTIASAMLFGFGLLMPMAFAGAVWKYRWL